MVITARKEGYSDGGSTVLWERSGSTALVLRYKGSWARLGNRPELTYTELWSTYPFMESHLAFSHHLHLHAVRPKEDLRVAPSPCAT